MKKTLFPMIILIVVLIGVGLSFHSGKKQEGLTKTEVEEIYQREISNEEWNEMTNHGKTPIIGGGNASTEMELENE
ncbi:MAG: hypothetical protein Q4Q07_08180 [Tissierellia bacterium]|nr:hypothetical protein [Tissierellia bacterium]